MAAELPLADVDAVVGVGGDGTLNEIIGGLLARRESPPPLGVIPLGTANVIARELGIPLNDDAAIARIIATAQPTHIHVGSANGQAFVQMAGCGFDARVVAHVSLRLKRHVGRLAYVWQTLAEAARNTPSRYAVRIDGRDHDAASVVIANGRFYGGPFVAVPNARLTAPTLFVCLLGGARRRDVLRYGWGLVSGRLSQFHDVRIVEGRHVEVESKLPADAHGVVQADGDIATALPLRVSLHDRTLPVLAAPA